MYLTSKPEKMIRSEPEKWRQALQNRISHAWECPGKQFLRHRRSFRTSRGATQSDPGALSSAGRPPRGVWRVRTARFPCSCAENCDAQRQNPKVGHSKGLRPLPPTPKQICLRVQVHGQAQARVRLRLKVGDKVAQISIYRFQI